MRIIGERVLHEQSWTCLKEKRYRDGAGREKGWTYIERRGRREAAVAVAVTERSGSLVLIEQYRIPFEGEVVEFPAGLIDPGESPAQAACRELAEETGYTGAVTCIGPAVSTSAGLATETVHMVYMRVGEEPGVQTKHEPSERIRVFTLHPARFGSFLRECGREGRLLDAKLFVYLKERGGEQR